MFVSCLVVTMVSVACSRSGEIESAAAKPIVVCSALDNKPIEYREEDDSKAAGLGIDLLDQIARASGREIFVKSTSRSAQFTWLADGKCNVIASSLTADEVVKGGAVASEAYYHDDLVVLGRAGEGHDAPDVNSLNGRKVGVVRDSTADRYLIATNFPGADIRRYPAAADTFAALNVNRLHTDAGVEAVLGDIAALSFRASKDSNLSVGPRIETQRTFHYAVRSDDADSLSRLNDGLAGLAMTGVLTEVNNTYLEKYVP